MPVESLEVESLEQEAEVAETARTISKTVAAQESAVAADQSSTGQKAAGKQPKSIWREIFEGHEEMLGWTPD